MGIKISNIDNPIQAYDPKNNEPAALDKKAARSSAQNINADSHENEARYTITTSHLDIRMHDETGDVMVKVIDDNTGEVIREIPPEKFLDMIVEFQKIDGVFIDKKA